MHIAEQPLVAWGCLSVRAAEAYGQTARGGSHLDVAQVIIGVIEQQKDFVVAIKVAGSERSAPIPMPKLPRKTKVSCWPFCS